VNKKVPNVIFKTRIRDKSLGTKNPFKWENRSSDISTNDSYGISSPEKFIKRFKK
tara:strand:- start:149 stop:313 length:165 start_codon:yes stop_codon:yes gene_type:complete